MSLSSFAKLASAVFFLIAGLVAFGVVTWTPWEAWALFALAAYVISLVPVRVA